MARSTKVKDVSDDEKVAGRLFTGLNLAQANGGISAV